MFKTNLINILRITISCKSYHIYNEINAYFYILVCLVGESFRFVITFIILFLILLPDIKKVQYMKTRIQSRS